MSAPTPPHSDDAEMALLGALLQSNRALEKVSEFLKPQHFANSIHGRLYAAITSLIGAGKVADQITLRQYFEGDDDLESVGGWAYIVAVSQSMVSLLNTEDYGRTIHDLYLRREIINLAKEAADLAYCGDLDTTAQGIIETVEGRLTGITLSMEAESAPQSLAQAIPIYLAEREAIAQARGRPVGIISGLPDLDRVIGGFANGKLYVLAGRPSMGKTALALTIANHAVREGYTVGFTELEMSTSDLIARLVADLTGIDTQRQAFGELTQDDIREIVDATNVIHHLPLYMDDNSSLSTAQIKTRALRLKRKKNLKMVVVDHLGLVRAADPRRARHEQLSQITSDLKGIAKDLDVPVIALCQLSRGVEAREDKRPTLSDLRESGSIEENADVVMFVYREQYYLERDEPKQFPTETEEKFANRRSQWETRCAAVQNLADIMVPKNRSGRSGYAKLVFDGEKSKFLSLAHQTRFQEGYRPARQEGFPE